MKKRKFKKKVGWKKVKKIQVCPQFIRKSPTKTIFMNVCLGNVKNLINSMTSS